MMVLLKLVLGHLLGDFVLQPQRFVRQKEQYKVRAPFLYLHALLHGALPLLLVWEASFWPFALLIAGTHLLIDLGKLYLQYLPYQRLLFLLDQLLHLLVLVLVWQWWTKEPLNYQWLFTDEKFVFYTALVFLTLPASIIIKIFISAWTPEKQRESSLENAGNWIGILERLLIFGFLIAGKWEAVGFLLAAKSVFRFGDLRESQDRKLTEYILIGTLTSFTLAIITGLLYLQALAMLKKSPEQDNLKSAVERRMPLQPLSTEKSSR